jgi:serine/threonine protein kinase
MRQTLEAIAHLENVGIVHNDIRLDNIMCDEATGQMKVIDFGVSVQAGAAPASFPLRHGTASPDVLDRDAAGNWSGAKAGVTAKHDVFGVGAATYQAGEKKAFDYHSGFGQGLLTELVKFGQYESDGKSKQAIRPGDKQNPAFEVTEQFMGSERGGKKRKAPEKVAGRSGAGTAYTEFVNRLMDPNPELRLTPAAALQDPFLTDSLLDEDQAREVLKKALAPPPPAAGAEKPDENDVDDIADDDDELYVKLQEPEETNKESGEEATTEPTPAGKAPAAGQADSGSYTQLGQPPASPDSGSYTQLGQPPASPDSGSYTQLGQPPASPDSGSYTQLGQPPASPDSGSYTQLGAKPKQ